MEICHGIFFLCTFEIWHKIFKIGIMSVYLIRLLSWLHEEVYVKCLVSRGPGPEKVLKAKAVIVLLASLQLRPSSFIYITLRAFWINLTQNFSPLENLPPQQALFLLGYYKLLYRHWNGSFSNTIFSLYNNPSEMRNTDLGIKPGSSALQADSLWTELWGKPNTHTKNVK